MGFGWLLSSRLGEGVGILRSSSGWVEELRCWSKGESYEVEVRVV